MSTTIDTDVEVMKNKIAYLEKEIAQAMEELKKVQDLKDRASFLEREIVRMTSEINQLKIDVNKALNEYKEDNKKHNEKITTGIDDMNKKLTELKSESTYARGFIKAILLVAGVVGFTISLLFKFV